MALVDQGGGPGDCLRRRPARVCGVDQVKTIEELFAEFVGPPSEAYRWHQREGFFAGAAAMASIFAAGGITVIATPVPPHIAPCNHTSLLTGETTILNGTCALCGQRGL